MLPIAIISILFALLFYTIGVWWEHINRELRKVHVLFFFMGLLCDITGTSLMAVISSKAASESSSGIMSAHAITGYIAIVLMLLHFTWAVFVLIRDRMEEKAGFHKFSIFVWLVWLVPFVIGMMMGSGKGNMEMMTEPKIIETEYSVSEHIFENNGQRIVGDMYTPNIDSPHPVVIMCHGFGANSTYCEQYAKYFAGHGMAAFTFDFIGGGNNIRSDGKTTEMSVLTESADLDVVIDNVASLPEIDAGAVFLMGESQGGFVSTYVTCKRPDDIAGLVLLYPAFIIPEYSQRVKENLDELPNTMPLLGTTIGKMYVEDACDIDIYSMMKEYDKSVLILHGKDDDALNEDMDRQTLEAMVQDVNAGNVFTCHAII